MKAYFLKDVTALTVTAAGPGKELAAWPCAVRAEYYRVFVKRIGVDTEAVNIADPAGFGVHAERADRREYDRAVCRADERRRRGAGEPDVDQGGGGVEIRG